MFAVALERRSVRISLRGGGTGNLTSHAEYHIAIQHIQTFLVFALYGPDKLVCLSQSRQSVSACTSKTLRLLGLSIASQDRYSITGFCSIMTELVYPFSITAILHLASNHIVVKICRRPIFVPKSLERPRTWLSGARSRTNHSLYVGNEIRLNP